MRRYILYIVCVIAALGLGGCVAADDNDILFREGDVTLTLSLGDLTRNNTADNGVGEGTNDDDASGIVLNENKIASLEIFLYANGAEDKDATYATRIEGLNGRDRVDNVKFSIPADALSTLFAGGATTCGIYVIANYDTGRTIAVNGIYEDTSIEELKAIEVTSSFDALQSLNLAALDASYSGSVQNIKPQEYFVMDSDLATVTKSGNNLSGTVYITRAASKITFRATIAQSLEIDGKRWVPMLENLSFSYNNIVNKGYIDNGSDTNATFAMPTGEGVYATAKGIQMAELGGETPNYGSEVEGVSRWTTIDHVIPLYTYSSYWSDGANNQAYIMLTVPWKVEDEGNEALTYYNYFVPLNMNELKLVRNKHYRINLRVGVLGDLEELTESEYSYEVLDWVGEDISVELNKPTYLVVDQNYVVMKNIEEFSVGYHSSDEVECEVLSTTISNEVRSGGVIVSYSSYREFYLNGVEMTPDNYEDKTISAPDGKVTFTHGLDNTRSDTDTDYDFLVQTTVVRVYHKNNPDIYEDITFVQYPAMYVTVNAGYEKDDRGNNLWNYVTVNGNVWSTSRGAGQGCPKVGNQTVYWVGVGGKSFADTNHNMYKITVTAFDATTANYIVADPRKEPENFTIFPKYSNSGSSNSSPAYPVQADQLGVEEIKGYRGTLVENADNLVAPEFIVASFCSTCTNADRNLYPNNSAYYRCASYQEAGYPAGRWRIPTTAELEVVGKLCAQGKLPQIFQNGEEYPSSSGIFANNKGTFTPTTSPATSVRCVYDTWYWKDKCNDESMKELLWAAEGNVADMKADGVYDNYLQRVK